MSYGYDGFVFCGYGNIIGDRVGQFFAFHDLFDMDDKGSHHQKNS